MRGGDKLLTLVLVLIPVLLAFGLRISASDLPATDGWASSTVYTYYFNQLKSQVDQQYPNLPDQKKGEIIAPQMQNMMKTPAYSQQVQEASQFFKNYYRYDNDKYFYMPDIDPYEYLKEAQDIIDHGHIGDVQKSDGYWYNMHALAPNGQKIYTEDLHPRVVAWVYRIGSFFNPKTTLMQTSLYIPALFSALATIFVFLILNRLVGKVGGFFGALLYGIHPLILTRTLWGHADTDIWQVLFMPMILYFAMSMIMSEGKKRYLYALFGGLSVGLFAFSWNQWYVTFDMVLGAIGIYMVILFMKELMTSKDTLFNTYKKSVKSHILILIFYLMVAGLFVSLLGTGGLSSFIDAPFVIFSNLAIKNAAYSDLWPNVYTTVAELAPIGFTGVLGLIGRLWVGLAIAGIIISLIKKEWLFALSTVFLFISGTAAALVAGVRFAMFTIFPICLAVGFALGYAHKLATEWTVNLI